MTTPRLPLACLSLPVAGCTSAWERSYDRWSGYRFQTDAVGKWSGCIDEQSNHYLEYPRPFDGSNSELFARVLADCRALTSGPEWSAMGSKKAQQLRSDAWQAFSRTEIDIRMRMDESII